MISLAIDVMGGDEAPDVCIEGISIFHKKYPDTTFLLFGDETVVAPILHRYKNLDSSCRMIHTDESISPHTKPSSAVRQFPKSSMRMALESVANKSADGAVSAGNTGAYLALSKTILKTLGSIDRPAIASQFPSMQNQIVLLDLGGTLDVSSRNLVEYAQMGSIFAEKVLHLHRPSVGLLNVGKEESKGSDTLQQAFLSLKSSGLNFHGFVEGHDIALGTVSVVVTDGFTGNVALKTAEGIAKLCFSSVKECFSSGAHGKLVGWLARPFLKRIQARFDPRIYNGALWLGLNGIAVKSHGGTDALGFSYALQMAYDMVRANIVSEIDAELNAKEDAVVKINASDVEISSYAS
jgi:glycerol-3-phosphate acyltransferase PlsX